MFFFFTFQAYTLPHKYIELYVCYPIQNTCLFEFWSSFALMLPFYVVSMYDQHSFFQKYMIGEEEAPRLSSLLF